ncbi:MAG: ATP-grasp domain-containing protein [Candidatus Riflebacteria bacterium]|nr:ATP-grasp domain-containing protein [Candidatus Riflebacteria bacterium]
MNIVYLSPHFPPNYYNFCVRIAEMKANVLGIGDCPYENLRPELKASLKDYYKVSNLENYLEVYKACAYFTWKYGRIDRIESHIEHWLGLEGELREDFNIFGPKKAQTEAFRRKSEMKKVFRNAGIPVAEGEMFSGEPALRKFIEKVGYPIIAKPDIGVGAWQTWKICNEDNLREFLEKHASVDYFLEEFISGTLYTFDGITDTTGNIVFCTSHHSDTGVLELVSDNLDLSYYSLREIPGELQELGEKIVAAFKLPEKFFHIEFFKRFKDNVYTVLEINCRPPGGFTTDIINYTADTDVYRIWAEIAFFGKTSTQFERKYHCAHIARKFGKNYVLSHDEVLKQFGENIVFHEHVPDVFSAVMGNYTYIARTKTEPEIRNLITQIQKTG